MESAHDVNISFCPASGASSISAHQHSNYGGEVQVRARGGGKLTIRVCVYGISLYISGQQTALISTERAVRRILSIWAIMAQATVDTMVTSRLRSPYHQQQAPECACRGCAGRAESVQVFRWLWRLDVRPRAGVCEGLPSTKAA